jgi:hypothetical protein
MLGGQLVVGGGINGERTAAGLADLLPVEVARTLAQGDLTPLARLGGSEPQPSTGPLLTVIPRPGAEALPAGHSLIYRGRLGSGMVIFSTFDLALLRGWASEPQLWSNVLQPIPLFVPAFEARVNQINVMQGHAADPGCRVASASALAAFLIVYILVVGTGELPGAPPDWTPRMGMVDDSTHGDAVCWRCLCGGICASRRTGATLSGGDHPGDGT